MKIYKHLLEDEKLKNKELQSNAEKFKANFSAMAYRTLTENVQNLKNNSKETDNALQDQKDFMKRNTGSKLLKTLKSMESKGFQSLEEMEPSREQIS